MTFLNICKSIFSFLAAFVSCFAFQSLANSSIHRKTVDPSQDHFIVIGAGMSGLTTARTLIKSGVPPHRITIIDKESGPGGKVDTHIVEGRPYEMGAQIIIPGLYKDIEDLNKELGLKTLPLERGFFFDIRNGEKKPVITAEEAPAFKEQLSRYLKMYSELWHQEQDPTSPYRLLDIDGLGKVHPKLSMPWHQFVKENNFELIEKALISLLGGSGPEYDIFNRSFAARIVRAMRPELINNLFVQGKAVEIYDGQGFQNLTKTLAEELRIAGVQFKFNESVISIIPSHKGKATVHLKSGQITSVQYAEQIIFTGNAKYLPQLIQDSAKWGHQVYSKVTHSDYRTFIVKLTGIPSIHGVSGSSSIIPNILGGEQSDRAFPVGIPILLLKPYKDSDIVMISAHGKEGLPNEHIETNIVEMFSKIGGNAQILAGRAWQYRPRFSGNDSEYYKQAMKSQGSGGIWVNGEVFDFGSIHSTYRTAIEYTEHLVKNRFDDLGKPLVNGSLGMCRSFYGAKL